jgi:hypothetical protein
MRPVARRERSRRVDVRHPPACAQCARDELAQERDFSAPARTDDFRQSPARQSSTHQPRIQRFHARWQCAFLRTGRGKRVGEEVDERLWKHRSLVGITPATAETAATRRGE